MARKFLTPIDLTKLEIQNVALQNLGSDPSTPATGQIYYNTAGAAVKVYTGSSWLSLSTTSGTVTSVTGTSPVVSSGGTTPAISLASGYGDTLNPYASKSQNTILAAPSGSAGVPTFRSLAAADIPSTLAATTFSGAVAMGTNRITGVGEPSGAQDAATKAYVDTLATGINAHEAVSYASTANITGTYANGTAGVGATLTGTGSIVIDGYTVVAGDAGTNIQGGTGLRLLLKDQTNTDQNGIYTVTACVSTTSWTLTRAYDYDALGEVAAGDFTYVLLGTANTKFTFVETSKPAAISGVGTAGNAITFGIFANGNLSGIVTGTQGGTGINNGSKTITISGNVTIGSSTDTVQFTTAGATNVTLPTTGTLLTSATAVTAGFTKKAASTVALTANTQATINHALGTQAVIVQMYETTSSLPTNLVDMDVVAFDTNNVKVTSQTSGTYYYVIIG